MPLTKISALVKRLPTSATLAHYAIGQLCPMYALCLIVAMNLAINQSLPLNGQRVLNCSLLISYVCPEYGRVSVIYFLYTFAQCYDLILNKVSLKKGLFRKFRFWTVHTALGVFFFQRHPVLLRKLMLSHLSMIRFSLYQRTLGGGSPPVATHIIVNGSPSLNGPTG